MFSKRNLLNYLILLSFSLGLMSCQKKKSGGGAAGNSAGNRSPITSSGAGTESVVGVNPKVEPGTYTLNTSGSNTYSLQFDPNGKSASYKMLQNGESVLDFKFTFQRQVGSAATVFSNIVPEVITLGGGDFGACNYNNSPLQATIQKFDKANNTELGKSITASTDGKCTINLLAINKFFEASEKSSTRSLDLPPVSSNNIFQDLFKKNGDSGNQKASDLKGTLRAGDVQQPAPTKAFVPYYDYNKKEKEFDCNISPYDYQSPENLGSSYPPDLQNFISDYIFQNFFPIANVFKYFPNKDEKYAAHLEVFKKCTEGPLKTVVEAKFQETQRGIEDFLNTTLRDPNSTEIFATYTRKIFAPVSVSIGTAEATNSLIINKFTLSLDVLSKDVLSSCAEWENNADTSSKVFNLTSLTNKLCIDYKPLIDYITRMTDPGKKLFKFNNNLLSLNINSFDKDLKLKGDPTFTYNIPSQKNGSSSKTSPQSSLILNLSYKDDKELKDIFANTFSHSNLESVSLEVPQNNSLQVFSVTCGGMPIVNNTLVLGACDPKTMSVLLAISEKEKVSNPAFLNTCTSIGTLNFKDMQKKYLYNCNLAEYVKSYIGLLLKDVSSDDLKSKKESVLSGKSSLKSEIGSTVGLSLISPYLEKIKSLFMGMSIEFDMKDSTKPFIKSIFFTNDTKVQTPLLNDYDKTVCNKLMGGENGIICGNGLQNLLNAPPPK